MNYKFTFHTYGKADKKNAPLWVISVLIFINSDTFFFAFNQNKFIQGFPRYLGLAICVILFIRLLINKEKIVSRLIFPAVFMSGFVIASSLVNNDNFNRTITTVAFIVEGMLVAHEFSYDSIFEKFEKVMYFLASTSILIWIVAELFPGIIKSFPMVSPDSSRIYNLFVGGVFENNILSGKLIRSCSIFWEPGVFQIYLNLALAYLLLIMSELNTKRIAIYILAILLTFSTASIATTAFLFVIHVLFKKTDQKDRKKKTSLVILAVSIVIISVLYIGFDNIYDTYFNKVFQKGHGSTAMRMGSLIIGGLITLKNPLFGIGAINLRETFKYYMLSMQFVTFANTYSFTNTIMYFFAVYGMPVGIPFLIGNFKFSNHFTRSNIYKIAILVWIILLYIDESLNSSVWPWIICFLGWHGSDINTESEVNAS